MFEIYISSHRKGWHTSTIKLNCGKGHIITYGSRGSIELVGGGDHSILRPSFLGDHSIPGPIYGGINKSSSWRVHKIDLMDDHGFKIFAAMLRALLFM